MEGNIKVIPKEKFKTVINLYNLAYLKGLSKEELIQIILKNQSNNM